MINNFCQPLEVPFLLNIEVLTNIKRSDAQINARTQIEQYNINDSIDVELIKFLDQFNLYVAHAEVFYTPPHVSIPIHIDGSRVSNLTKINWVFGAPGSKMSWWKPKDSTSPIQVKQTVIGTKYLSIDNKHASRLWTAEIAQSTLINAGNFHSVDNCTDEGRWCVSYIIGNHNTNSDLQWDDAVSIFLPYFK